MLEALLATAADNPFLSAILANFGYDAYNTAKQAIFGPSPYEQAVQQQVNVGNQLIPQLQAQMQGKQTAASRNLMQQVRQNTTQAQQSYAAGATARGAGGTPVAAQQSRFRAAETQTMGNVLGQYQMNAQNQLAGIAAGGVQALGGIEAQKRAQKDAATADFMDFLGYYREHRGEPEWDSMYENGKWNLKSLLNGLKGLDIAKPVGPQMTR